MRIPVLPLVAVVLSVTVQSSAQYPAPDAGSNIQLAHEDGRLRKLDERTLLLQISAGPVRRFRLLAKTQFVDRQGAPIRDSLLSVGDQLSVLASPDDYETAVRVVLLREGTAPERESAAQSVAENLIRAPEKEDFESVEPKDASSDETVYRRAIDGVTLPRPTLGGWNATTIATKLRVRGEFDLY